MEKPHDPTLEALRARIAGDLAPVRPWHPLRWLLPLEIASVVALVIWLWRVFDWREGQPAGSLLWLLMPSVLELGAALVLLGAALFFAVPGRTASLTLLGWAAAAGVAVHVVIALASHAQAPLAIPLGEVGATDLYCFNAVSRLAVPSVLIALILAGRGLSVRPRRAGVLAGLGAGLAADAIWRLFCPYTEPAHVLGSHTLAIAVSVLLGWLLATLWELGRVLWWRRRESGPG